MRNPCGATKPAVPPKSAALIVSNDVSFAARSELIAALDWGDRADVWNPNGEGRLNPNVAERIIWAIRQTGVAKKKTERTTSDSW
jgi:hypothetical protein